MRHSESLVSLAPALVSAQRDFPVIGKDAQNPEYRSAYASLDKIVETVRPILAGHGLSVVQGAEQNESALVVTTCLLHRSGEWIETAVVMPLVGRMLKGGSRAEPDPQSAGSAVSYGRRYGICAALGLVTGEDDDGNTASKPARQRAAPRPEPTQAPAPVGSKRPEDRIFKGQTLGSRASKELEQLLKWARGKGMDDLASSIADVLNDRALGLDDDNVVRRAVAAEERETAKLPF